MYGILRGLLIGGNYRYSHTDCGIATPDSGSLECVFGYNYTDMSDTGPIFMAAFERCLLYCQLLYQ